MDIINEVAEQVNIQTGLDVIIIRAYDKKGEWQLEVIFSGGAKVTGPITADEAGTIESDLADRGWVVLPSLFSNGFSAKPVEVEEFIFASSAGLPLGGLKGLWPDDLGLAEPTL